MLPTGDLVAKIESKASQGDVSFLKDERVRIGKLEHNQSFNQLFGILITKIAALSGLKGQISQLDKDDIYKIILNRFKELSFDEIYKAFELDRSGVYDKENEHFGLFNAKYVSKILSQYLKWRAKKRHELKIGIEPPEEIKPTYEENMKALEDGVVRLMLYFSENKLIPVGNVHLYKYLRNSGKIQQATGDDRDRIVKKAKASLALENDFAKGVRKAIISESALMNECKRIQLQEYFETELIKLENGD